MFQSRSPFLKLAAFSAITIFLVLLFLSAQGLTFTDLEFGLPLRHDRHRPDRGRERGGRKGQGQGHGNAHSAHDSLTNVTSGNGTVPVVPSWEKPQGVSRIMGLVFYGRRRTVSILDCYLQKNLVKNGGALDAVIFVVRTKDEADLAVLDKMVAREPDYIKQEVDLDGDGYSSAYDYIKDDIMYIKMDDDIVYVEDTTIKAMVDTKAARPDFYIVSANVINQILFSWIHRNFGAVKAYLPEIRKHAAEDADKPPSDWRPSLLPSWRGPSNFDAEAWAEDPETANARWLPVTDRDSRYSLQGTPIDNVNYTYGYSHRHWQVAAQEHSSLLENLEKDELWRYRFPLWDFELTRMGIQFVALMGKDINLAKPIPGDDEHHFSVEMPTRLNRHAVADGTGVVAHFAYGTQGGEPGMYNADILARYRLYAEENICKHGVVWSPNDDDDGGYTE